MYDPCTPHMGLEDGMLGRRIAWGRSATKNRKAPPLILTVVMAFDLGGIDSWCTSGGSNGGGQRGQGILEHRIPTHWVGVMLIVPYMPQRGVLLRNFDELGSVGPFVVRKRFLHHGDPASHPSQI